MVDEFLSDYDLATLSRVVEAGAEGARLDDHFQASVLTLAGLVTRASRADGRYEATVSGRAYVANRDAMEGRR